ncbi:unnamed protein product [Orchesella dallaii]|uniref:CHK kinase-like domain-containing protein n=1 Tax=Orchesella dallaii TaxID=48710 RepID=A0ABP1Q909_9HEXA
MNIPTNVIDTVAQGHKRDARVVSFSVEDGTEPGDNFMSVMYRVRIDITTLELNDKRILEEEAETLHVMLKCLPCDPLCTAIVEDSNSFEKELGMYTRIFQAMIAFQESKGLMESEIFKGWPHLYAADDGNDFKFLAMQDLQFLGFKMMERSSMLDLLHTRAVLKGLASFHALSFAMFHGDYDLILSGYPFLKEMMFRPTLEVTTSQQSFVQMAFSSVSSILRDAGEVDAAEAWENLNEELNYFERMHNLVGSKVKNAVIGFGDCWKNNILFSYDSQGNLKESSVKFVDFQLARVCCRAIDVGYFLYTSVEIDILNENEEQILRFYHEEFKSFLRKLGFNPKQFGLTWKKFLKEYQDYRLYGVMLGLMLSPALYPDTNDLNGLNGRFDNTNENVICTKEEEVICTTDTAEMGKGLQHSVITERIRLIATKHLSLCEMQMI